MKSTGTHVFGIAELRGADLMQLLYDKIYACGVSRLEYSRNEIRFISGMAMFSSILNPLAGTVKGRIWMERTASHVTLHYEEHNIVFGMVLGPVFAIEAAPVGFYVMYPEEWYVAIFLGGFYLLVGGVLLGIMALFHRHNICRMIRKLQRDVVVLGK